MDKQIKHYQDWLDFVHEYGDPMVPHTRCYQDTVVQLTLTDGSTYAGPIASGQSFHAIPPGQNQVHAPDFYPPRYAPRAKAGA
jgi:hypothetical protein